VAWELLPSKIMGWCGEVWRMRIDKHCMKGITLNSDGGGGII
jgi:hypothetical protein